MPVRDCGFDSHGGYMAYKNKEDMQNYLRKRYANRQNLYNVLKDVPCADCGIKYAPHIMQFDHLRDKSFQISDNWSASEGRLREEVAKCEVVCANCHAERTFQRRSTKWVSNSTV